MTMTIHAWAPVLALVATFGAARVPDRSFERPGPWHYRSVACTETTVVDVSAPPGTARIDDAHSGDVAVRFATHLGVDPLTPRELAMVYHYARLPGNHVMASERPGDRVQLCFLGGPEPSISCDPDRDGRGRMYRVYDYRQRASYRGWNSAHNCGGA